MRSKTKCRELHVHMTMDEVTNRTCQTYVATYEQVTNPQIWKIVHTTQTPFLSWIYAERLFVHAYGRSHEITLGDCEGTNREIREGHNLQKMLISGEFSWFQG